MAESPSPSSSSRDIARILGAIDSEVVNKVLKNESTHDRDLEALVRLADESRSRIAGVLDVGTDGAVAEDLGAEALGLPTVSQILAEYEELRQIRDDLIKSFALRTSQILALQEGNADANLRKRATVQEDVMTPPGEVETSIKPGDGGGIRKEFEERFAMLQVLLLDLGIDPLDEKEVQITLGEVSKTMMRELTYVSVFVRKLGRLIEVCNEVGNRSFVWKTKDEADIARFGAMTKDEKIAYLETNPASGTDLVMARGWEGRMRVLLLNEEMGAREPTSGIAKKILKEKTDYETTWKQHCEKIKTYLEKHAGSHPSQKTSLGRWLTYQRKLWKKGKLKVERIAALEAIGIEIPKDAPERQDFNDWLDKWRKFRKSHPNGTPPIKTPLYNWLRTIRDEMRDEDFPKDQFAVLKSLGIRPAAMRGAPRSFDESLDELLKYREAHNGDNPEPRTRLHSWIAVQKQKMQDGKLSPKEVESLKELGITPAKIRAPRIRPRENPSSSMSYEELRNRLRRREVYRKNVRDRNAIETQDVDVEE